MWLKKEKLKIVLEQLGYLWYSWYGVILAAVITSILGYEQHKYNLSFWTAKYFSDMLTALITFLSIVIGIFGILIPSMISAREDKEGITNYFFENVDGRFWAKCIRRIISSGILAIICICFLYLQDIIIEKVYIWIFRMSIFFILYFCFGSYRFIGIMLNLLIGKNKKTIEKRTKKYKNKTNDIEQKKINERLINRNNNMEHK